MVFRETSSSWINKRLFKLLLIDNLSIHRIQPRRGVMSVTQNLEIATCLATDLPLKQIR